MHKLLVPDIDCFKARLKALDLKATPQRLAVHEAMVALVHASAESVVEYIRSSSDAHVTVSSVYNILSFLSEKGVYGRRMTAGSKMLFDVVPENHVHLYDSASDSVVDIVDEELVSMVESHFRKRRFKGFKLDRVDIQLVCHPTRRGVKK